MTERHFTHSPFELRETGGQCNSHLIIRKGTVVYRLTGWAWFPGFSRSWSARPHHSDKYFDQRVSSSDETTICATGETTETTVVWQVPPCALRRGPRNSQLSLRFASLPSISVSRPPLVRANSMNGSVSYTCAYIRHVMQGCYNNKNSRSNSRDCSLMFYFGYIVSK